MSSIFKFKKFSVKQNQIVFKVGTDAVLAGCLANVSKAEKILDIGTGTGVIALICAQRNAKADIFAIDSEEEAYKLSKENSENSPFASRITIQLSDIKEYIPSQVIDYIICNPPYFKITEQLHTKHPVARHQLKLDYTELLRKSSEILSEQGTIGYIFPYEEETQLINIAQQFKLFPVRAVRISGIKNGKIKRTFLEFSFSRKTLVTEELYIEESPRVWSDEYKKLTREFYL